MLSSPARAARQEDILACVVAASTALAPSLRLALAQSAERRDLKDVGLDALREEVALLLARPPIPVDGANYFGNYLTPQDTAPRLQRLSTRAASVHLSERGVVIVTDGLGDFRGGYLIMPLNTTLPAEQLSSSAVRQPIQHMRPVAEGVVYIIRQ